MNHGLDQDAARLIAQSVLLGNITPGMAEVHIRWTETTYEMEIISDAPEDPRELAIAEGIRSELMAQLPDHEVSVHLARQPMIGGLAPNKSMVFDRSRE